MASNLDEEDLSRKRIRNLFSISTPSYVAYGTVDGIAKEIDKMFKECI